MILLLGDCLGIAWGLLRKRGLRMLEYEQVFQMRETGEEKLIVKQRDEESNSATFGLLLLGCWSNERFLVSLSSPSFLVQHGLIHHRTDPA